MLNARVAAALERLALRAPQVLLLEGGSEKDRMRMALYWAQLANCSVARKSRLTGETGRPCGKCPICRQIAANEFIDLHIYDGRISNRQDEESPGPARALSMENMRELKRLNATAPHGEGRRAAIFLGMGQTREEALNSLLKTLEEPTEHTVFVLLAPQRQQLLPTLVSRSFCMTLPWPGCQAPDRDLVDWEQALGVFLARGAGFLDKISAKGAMDAALAGRLIMVCQRALGRALAGKPFGDNALDRAVAPLAAHIPSALLMQRWAAEAQEMLAAAVAPARVLEGFCSRLFILLREAQAAL